MATPAVLVVTPLTGLAFHSDQRIAIYEFAARFGANPFRIIRENVAEIGHFIQKGNFRPVGRFVFYLEESARFEVAMALGIPPHVIQGLFRMLMVGLLAWAATGVVLALHRSIQHRTPVEHQGGSDLIAGVRDHEQQRCPALLSVFPLLLAGALIVMQPLHPISFFPVFLIGLSIIVLLVPLYVASDKAMYGQGITKSSFLVTFLLGSLSAMTYELLYLLPLVILLMICLRGRLAGLSVREILSSTACRRFLVFLGSFLLVFIPSRLAIANACATSDCFGNTEVALSNLSVGQWIGRALSGLPLLEWIAILDSRSIRGIHPIGFGDIIGNVWLLFVVAAFVLLAVRASKQFVAESSRCATPVPYRDLGVSLIAFGAVLALAVTLMVSSSEGLQVWNERGEGLHQWRDTLLVQVGWAFVSYGALVLVISAFTPSAGSRRRARRWPGSVATVTVAACFTMMLVLTLSANDRYARAQRSRPDTNLVNLISAASIEFERTEEGSARRCRLIAEYTLLACESCWHSGPRLVEQLNDLSVSRYGSEFCPLPFQDGQAEGRSAQ